MCLPDLKIRVSDGRKAKQDQDKIPEDEDLNHTCRSEDGRQEEILISCSVCVCKTLGLSRSVCAVRRLTE
jgi:hypothetical protein